MSLQSVLQTVSGRVGFTVDETKFSPNLQKRFGELRAMRGFLDKAGVEVNMLARTLVESRRYVLIPGLTGLLVALLGGTIMPLIVPGALCLGLSGFLYYTDARPLEQSLVRKKRELESIAGAFDAAVDRTAKEVTRELSTGWPSKNPEGSIDDLRPSV